MTPLKSFNSSASAKGFDASDCGLNAIDRSAVKQKKVLVVFSKIHKKLSVAYNINWTPGSTKSAVNNMATVKPAFEHMRDCGSWHQCVQPKSKGFSQWLEPLQSVYGSQLLLDKKTHPPTMKLMDP